MPKKSLGQNFLRDKKVLENIVESANLNVDDFVLEIGPGEGVLTEELTKHAKKVLSIEIDHELTPKLQEKFKNDSKVKIIEDDVLKINLPKLVTDEFSDGKNSIEYKLIANIPYYITSPIIRLFLETAFPPKEMILMVQKEVAERIVAKPGEMSILAVSVQYYANTQLLFNVAASSFYPAPEVDSAVIRIAHKMNLEKKEETKKFFRVVKAGFSSKRKTLLNNLSSGLQIEKKIVEKKLIEAGFGISQRAQELSIEDWKKLTEIFQD